MTKSSNSEDLTENNKPSLKRLDRAIALSQGQFSLILVCCNYPPLRLQVVKQLEEISSVPIETIILHPSVKTLFTTIHTSIEQLPPALMVFGLDSVVAIDQLLSATNLVRDEFRKQFPFPLIVWINDDILQKLIRLAPDFNSWAAPPIRFEVPKNQSLNRIVIMA